MDQHNVSSLSRCLFCSAMILTWNIVCNFLSEFFNAFHSSSHQWHLLPVPARFEVWSLVSELSKGIKAALYADHLVIWFKEECPTTATYRTQLATDKLDSWTEKWCVAVNKDKSSTSQTMCYLLDLPSMETRHKVEQVKAYLNGMQNPKNPLHDAVKEEKGCRLARGKSWMG